MLKDITLGQYYPADSPIHRLDPRVKIFSTVLYIVSLFIFRGAAGLALATAFLILAVALSKVPPVLMLKGVRAIWVLILITVVCNLFFSPDGSALLSLGPVSVTDRGIENAVYFTARLILLVAGTSVMTLTTTPNRLADGVEEGLKPLAKLGAPIHELAMMMSIALRFIPLLAEEADKIKKAQTARGVDFEEGGMIARVKKIVPILIPLFVSAFRRANDLALAMEARCYHGGGGRTKMRPLCYRKADGAAYAAAGAYLAAAIFLRVAGGTIL